ncbi:MULTISPECIES: HigA family addiction module antitoxin [Sphingomonas]|uniref:Addiction module HigA family antidote n=1 Tax=Sphingomonas trueperi TaxID=53317 RepID=A0A7X6BCP6_9SPHN|nr:HigA family addiction module antitoxin [Sphingomonas sp. ABOLD]NJB98314.1 addiction module HigA family antidote [Sphingomonas trueperi]
MPPDYGRLDNVHPGDVLREAFLVGADLPLVELAAGTGLDPVKLAAVVAGDAPVDANADLRLTRYLRMSEGFFLGLQMDFDLEEARRAMNGALDRIVPRAA